MHASASPAPQSAPPAPTSQPASADAVRERLRRLVIKERVSLGGLADAEREDALALVWAGLPTRVMSEAEVNGALKAALAGPAAWLATDHVELRRWLADAGWLQRDAFGRAYHRAEANTLLPIRQAAAAAVAALDTADFVRRSREAHGAERLARRQVWMKQGGRPGQARKGPHQRGAESSAPRPAGV